MTERTHRTFRKDLGDEELERLMKPYIEDLKSRVVPSPPRPEPEPGPEPASRPEKKERNKEKKKEEKRTEPDSGAQMREALSFEERECLQSIVDQPFLSITARAEVLGTSSYGFNKLKKALLKKNLVQEVALNLGFSTRGTVKLLDLTPAGCKAIGKAPQAEQPLMCSPEHWAWQKVFQAWYAQKGYHAVIEMALNGKRADVGLERQGIKSAVEIEMTAKHAVCNVTGDLDAGFSRVFVACRNTKVLNQVTEKLEAVLSPAQWARVKVLLIQDFAAVRLLVPKTRV